jgi:hypothetical protein
MLHASNEVQLALPRFPEAATTMGMLVVPVIWKPKLFERTPKLGPLA